MKEVQKEILLMKNKSCELDPIPMNLLKEILLTCIKTITHRVNTSLTKGIFAKKKTGRQQLCAPFLKTWP